MNFSLRRLDPESPMDIVLLREAFDWDNEDVPTWYDNAGQVFGPDSWEQCLNRARRETQIDVGVFKEEGFIGLITVVMLGSRIWEVFIAGPRRSNAELMTQAAFATAKDMFDSGIADRFVAWVYARHRGALKLNKNCGMVEDGVTMLKGKSHGRPLEWKRLVLTKQRMAELTHGR